VITIEKADEAEYLKIEENDQQILSAYGNINLRYNKILLKAEKLKLNTKTKEMMCEGDVILFDGNKEINGNKIFYNLDTGYGIIYEGQSKIGSFIYKGEKIKKVHNESYIIARGKFTSCSETPPHYYIEAKKLWVYPSNKIVMFDAYYVISDVKIFWIPLFLRFEKGTGIVTSWGKRDVEGWFAQNTLRFKLGHTIANNLKFDHYQKKGEYAGIDTHQNSKDSEILFSASGAYDKKLFDGSNIDPATGEMERSYRGKISFKNRLTFNKDKENESYNTTLRMGLFRQSDYSFIQDFETYRTIKPGFHYYDNPILYNDLYNQDENNWYFNLNDQRKNSSLSVKGNWLFRWNAVTEKYQLNNVTLPEINYSMNGLLGENPYSGETNKGFGFYPKIRYDTSVQLAHNDYYNENGTYLKSLDSRVVNVKLSRAFNFLNLFSYNPGMGIGDQAYWPYNVTDSEKSNYEKSSYSYGFLDENMQLGPSSMYMNFGHSLKWRFKEPSADDEYGKITAHSLSLNNYIGLINGLTYYGNTAYNLRYKKDKKFTEIERSRFSDLNNRLTFSMLRNVSFSETYIYSIKFSRPLTSNMNLNYSLADLALPLIRKVDRVGFNALWNHNFQNPRNSNLNLTTSLEIKFDPYWSLSFSTHSVNEKLYLYSRSLAKKYKVSETENSSSTYEYRNFFIDLLNSINFFQPSKMQDSYFKLRSANISINHDLHCWELAFGYTLNQKYFNYVNSTQYPYFEHSFWLRINMKVETELGIKEDLKTEPPEIVE
ncbi:MAG: hypothetical protein PHF84_05645, partial [bacterium]|nr:hypothetical protein [bacterium]